MTQPQIIDPYGVLVPLALMVNLMLEHGVCYGQAVTNTEVQQQKNTQVEISVCNTRESSLTSATESGGLKTTTGWYAAFGMNTNIYL